MKLVFSVLSFVFFISCAQAQNVQIDWDAVYSNSSRPEADVAQDEGRKSKELLEFFGVKPGDHVVDILAGSGYYTHLLTSLVGSDGKVYAGNNDFIMRFVKDRWNARLAMPALADVVRIDGAVDELALPQDSSIDFVLIANVYHDLLLTDEDRAKFNQILFKALKPGGVVGITDHKAKTGSPAVETAKTLHRMDKQIVLDELATAGFELAEESDLFSNPGDDLSTNVFQPNVRGKTDRFVLKFQKPTTNKFK